MNDCVRRERYGVIGFRDIVRVVFAQFDLPQGPVTRACANRSGFDIGARTGVKIITARVSGRARSTTVIKALCERSTDRNGGIGRHGMKVNDSGVRTIGG